MAFLADSYKPIFFAKDTFVYIRNNRWAWKYLIIPAIINFFLFFVIWLSLFSVIKAFLLGLSVFSLIPAFVSTLAAAVIFMVTLLVSLFLFFLLANLIASPFNGLLAEKMLIKEGLLKNTNNSILKTILIEIQRTVKFEIVKIILIICIFLLGLVVGAIPVIGFSLAGLINVAGNAYLALVDFFDPALSSMKTPVTQRFRYVRNHLKGNYGLYFVTMIVMFIPLVNIIYIPFAVVSSTLSYIEDQSK